MTNIMEILEKHAKNVGNHIRKHHKKYIFGTMGSLLAYLFFLKIFLFKVIIIKIILAILAIFGIYTRHTTFAQVQTICINEEKLIFMGKVYYGYTGMQQLVDKLKPTKEEINEIRDYYLMHR